ncbi:MAG: chemotaxis protein CheW [Coleofasciculaceae cyanobacterium]
MQSNLNKYFATSTGELFPGEQVQSLKLIVFALERLNLAFPVTYVEKVIRQKQVQGSGINQFGIANLNEQQVTVIDLYRKVFKTEQSSNYFIDGYLVIVKNSKDELYGVAVEKAPVLMDVPLSKIRVLPESYRRLDTLDIASHVAVIPQETETLTVFLLDVDLLLPV